MLSIHSPHPSSYQFNCLTWPWFRCGMLSFLIDVSMRSLTKLFFSSFSFFLSKMDQAQAKMLRAEKLLAKIEASMVPINPSDDQEIITDEERSVFFKIGLQMKSYLPLGKLLMYLTESSLLLYKLIAFLFCNSVYQAFVVFLMVSLRICTCTGNTESW